MNAAAARFCVHAVYTTPVGVVGVIFGYMISYFVQAGVYKHFASLGAYMLLMPQVVAQDSLRITAIGGCAVGGVVGIFAGLWLVERSIRRTETASIGE